MTSSTPSISSIAQELYDAFESFKRDGDDTTLYRLRDGSPEWMTELAREAHGGFMPDDWRYEAIMDAASHIADADAETDDDLDDRQGEFADSHVDVYTHDRLRWLSSNLNRSSYVDEAVEEFGHSDQGITGDIGLGQYFELEEVFASVRQSLADRLEEIVDEMAARETPLDR